MAGDSASGTYLGERGLASHVRDQDGRRLEARRNGDETTRVRDIRALVRGLAYLRIRDRRGAVLLGA